MFKKFIITIDTEGDNLWNWKDNDLITTKNSKYISKFQELCNKYDFYPVWLTNYEMAMDDYYVSYIKEKLNDNLCEVGMHLHAWNNPPEFTLKNQRKIQNFGEAPYLIEYPYEIMEKKIKYITDLLTLKFGVNPKSHRAGRWALNKNYLEILVKNGYKVDCTITPGIDWSNNLGRTVNSKGSNYKKIKSGARYIEVKNGKILEVPMTIKKINPMTIPFTVSLKNILKYGYYTVKGKKIWFRPNGYNEKELIKLSKTIYDDKNSDYLMFMLHSSELMPGGSPTFKNDTDIENLYITLEKIFYNLKNFYVGTSLEKYAEEFNINEKNRNIDIS